MAAGKYDLTIEQGATLQRRFIWKDEAGALVNLTGYSARLQVRASHDAAAALISLTTGGGGLTLGGAAGTIDALLADTATALLEAPLLGVWDLELIDAGGVVVRLLEGRARITPEVTR